ncbi:hypothetical protein Dimus_018187 [Dionaea muscipula]
MGSGLPGILRLQIWGGDAVSSSSLSSLVVFVLHCRYLRWSTPSSSSAESRWGRRLLVRGLLVFVFNGERSNVSPNDLQSAGFADEDTVRGRGSSEAG